MLHYKRRRRRRRKAKALKNVIKISFSLLILFISFKMIWGYFSSQNPKDIKINLTNSDINYYIEIADKASEGKAQVNWKYLAVIDGVRYKNDFSNKESNDTLELANKFIKENSHKTDNRLYNIRNLDEVLNDIDFNENDAEKAYKYLEDLKYVGLVSYTLAEDSPYVKFINEISDEAVQIYNQYRIFPSIIIAQAILESGWGESELSIKANNLFGIKADSSWDGEKVSMSTSEFYDEEIIDEFRVYKSKSDSIKDVGAFLNNNKRYKENGVFDATFYIEQAQAIEAAGYSTVEDEDGKKIYADLLVELIRQYNLQLIDSKVQMN